METGQRWLEVLLEFWSFHPISMMRREDMSTASGKERLGMFAGISSISTSSDSNSNKLTTSSGSFSVPSDGIVWLDGFLGLKTGCIF
jgi:hypothetical protein